MKRVVLGTAGHIDHGKTTLIKALTGVDCDRLKEEKQRGITIELGFTSLTLPDGQGVGIVDVPGHEKFIKNMVAGVGGIDAVMLMIAADEGVMPQTREHLDICRLLGVKSGLIVLTKADLVDADWAGLVTEDVRNFVKSSFLDSAPIIPVSSVTGAGIPDLIAGIAALVGQMHERPAAGVFRLPVDRVFSMKGFGTVVTGTLLSGSIAVGKEVEILPRNVKARIRGIQVHNKPAEIAVAGMRTALNMQGLDKASLERGDVVAAPDTLVPTRKAAAWFEHLKNAPRPLKNRTRVRFHAGTSELPGRVVILSAPELQPGEAGFVQIVFETPAVLLPHDRYVLRSYSPVFTIGGGEVLDILPPKYKRTSDGLQQRLAILKKGNISEMLQLFCREAGPAGLEFSQMQRRCGLNAQELQAIIDTLLSEKTAVAFNTNPLQITMPEVIRELEMQITGELKTYHSQNPLKAGMLKEELKVKLPKNTDAKLYSFCIENLEKKGGLTIAKEFLALPEHKPVLKEGEQGLKQRIALLYRDAGKEPPTKKELIEKLKIQEKEAASLLNLLAREGVLVKISEDIFYDATALQNLINAVVAHMQKAGELTIQSLKDLTGLSRKFMIPLLEYLDKAKITMRMGDRRVLRKQGN